MAEAAAARPVTSYTNPVEDWALSQITREVGINFDWHCSKDGNAHFQPDSPASTSDACRTISSRFIKKIIENPELASHIRRHGLFLYGANITGDLDLTRMEITGNVEIMNSRINSNISIDRSHIRGFFVLGFSTVRGWFDAGNSQIDDGLGLIQLNQIGNLDIRYSSVGGRLAIIASKVSSACTLHGTTIGHDLFISGSSFNNDVDISHVTVKDEMILSDTHTQGKLLASDMDVTGDITFGPKTTLAGQAIFDSTRVGGSLVFDGSRFQQDFHASGITIGGSIQSNGEAHFAGKISLDGSAKDSVRIFHSTFEKEYYAHLNIGGGIYLNVDKFLGNAEIDVKAVGEIMLNQSYFKGDLTARDFIAGGFFDMQWSTAEGNVDLSGGSAQKKLSLYGSTFRKKLDASSTTIGGDLDLSGNAIFNDDLDISRSNVAGNLNASHATFNADANLTGAKIEGDVLFEDSTVNGTVFADDLLVKQNFGANRASFYGPVTFSSAHIGDDLVFTDTTVTAIVLADATVSQELTLGGGGKSLKWRCRMPSPNRGLISTSSWPLSNYRWKGAECESWPVTHFAQIVLRNSEVGALQDNADAWPPTVDLEGFKYDHIGGVAGIRSDDMRTRTAFEWKNWLDRNEPFSTQPYEQLSAVLLASGHRETAEAIEYFERRRDQLESWNNGNYARWFFLFCLWITVGYGIGARLFMVFPWVAIFTVAGAGVLWFSPNARRHGFLWCIGASLDRLLPIVDLYKGFKDFFDNPTPQNSGESRNLARWQVAFFAGFALAGWALGTFVIAAVGGLLLKH